MYGPYNFLKWDLRFSLTQIHSQGHRRLAWLGWLKVSSAVTLLFAVWLSWKFPWMVLKTFYNGIWGFCVHQCVGAHAPYLAWLAWLAKPLKCFDFDDHNFWIYACMQKIRLTALKLTYLPNEALKWNMGARLHTKRAKSEKVRRPIFMLVKKVLSHQKSGL